MSKWAKFVTPVLGGLVVLLGLYLVFFKFQPFTISNVEIKGTKSFVNETDLKELAKSQSYGANLVFFDSGNLAKSLKETFQGAKEVYVSKKFPNALLITVIERTPLAIVYNQNADELFIVDEDGYVLGLVAPNTSNLPKIYYEGEIQVGLFLNTEVVSVYFNLIDAIDEEKISASSISVHSDYLQVYLPDSLDVLVGKDKDKFDAMKVVSQLLTQLKAEGKNPKVIDLRYDKVIVSYR